MLEDERTQKSADLEPPASPGKDPASDDGYHELVAERYRLRVGVITPPGRVGFLVVGSARSGTTLVQRLACEIADVRMPPETHFFSDFASDLVHRRKFPLTGVALREELELLSARDSSKGLGLDTDSMVEDLAGVAPSPFELFEAMVRALAGSAGVLGEKTPGHLLWWPAIARAAPWVKFVVVVRDPRAVTASSLSVPWTTSDDLASWGDRIHLPLAARWKFDQWTAARLSTTLGSDRCLVLRYEDVVADPDVARERIASLIGAPAGIPRQAAPSDIVLPWEQWKTDALGTVSPDRVSAWHDTLGHREALQVAAICRTGMAHFGYADRPGRVQAAILRARLGPEINRKLRRYLEPYHQYHRYITSVTL